MNKPTIEELRAIDLSEEFSRVVYPDDKGFYLGEPGIEHYKLLAWFGWQFNDIQITEIGTLWGGSAMALGQNKRNKVITYDVTEHDISRLPFNVERKIIDVKDTPFHYIVDSSLIFYDAKHEGKEEQEFLDELIKRQWKGILIFDDIDFNNAMRKFWKGITLRKEDWTDVGHSYGTGVVYFD